MPEEVARKPATSQFVDVRGEQHHVLTWGNPQSAPLVLLHGWMDVGASFQFLVDAFRNDWYAIAPDLRGFGRSAWQAQGYWVYDYLADLESLLRHFIGSEPARLVGHSLGGNIVMSYAGVRPDRVARVVSLEGFGIPAEAAEDAPRKVAKWLDAVADPPRFQTYDTIDAVADRLQKKNPRLARDQADFLAQWWARALPDGRAALRSDPRHKLPFPHVYRIEESVAIWRNVTAPVLWVAASDSEIPRWLEAHPEGEMGADGMEGVRRRMSYVRDARLVTIDDAGHMLHHDQPAAVAAQIESFLLD
ncbi:MAG TPA: alpha/beta hydrolase [Casimicrobiaceae bacterium]|nr:alpha/beta hydrolase [Casimicrobiaceae bacterium]